MEPAVREGGELLCPAVPQTISCFPPALKNTEVFNALSVAVSARIGFSPRLSWVFENVIRLSEVYFIYLSNKVKFNRYTLFVENSTGCFYICMCRW